MRNLRIYPSLNKKFPAYFDIMQEVVDNIENKFHHQFMGAYQYQAINSQGAQKRGLIEADSERHARQLLREQGFIPMALHSVMKRKQTARDKLKVQDLALMTRQLATLLSAGIPVEEALQGVCDQTEKEKVRTLIMGVRTKVLEGFGLAHAMGEFPHAFPELYRATVASGEQTGHLDTVLEKLADYTEAQQAIKHKVQQALIYPALMIFVSSGIISFLLAFVVPKIIEVFTSSGQSLPTATLILMSISHFIKQTGWYVLGVMVLFMIIFRQLIKKPHIKLYWHRTLLYLPMVAYLSKTSNAARYIHTFAILFSSGVNVLETMKVSASVVTNLIMREAFMKASDKVREGAPIHLALKQTHFLNPMAIHLIANGEKSGQLSTMMSRAASHLDNEVNRMIDTSLTLLEPLIILMMGAVVLFIVLATLLPIFSMEQLVVS